VLVIFQPVHCPLPGWMRARALRKSPSAAASLRPENGQEEAGSGPAPPASAASGLGVCVGCQGRSRGCPRRGGRPRLWAVPVARGKTHGAHWGRLGDLLPSRRKESASCHWGREHKQGHNTAPLIKKLYFLLMHWKRKKKDQFFPFGVL